MRKINIKKHLFAIFFVALGFFAVVFGVTEKNGVALRGYGEVSASFLDNAARFKCENRESAEIVYAKLIRDIVGCAAGVPSKPYKVGIKGNSVYVVSYDTKKDVDDFIKKFKIETPEPKAYPNYLDYFDLKALKFYARPMDSFLGFGVENHWPFAKKVGIEGFVFHGIDFVGTIGPNAYSFLRWDYGIKDAQRNGGMVTLCPSFAGMMPKWFFERYPEKCAKTQDHTLVREWIQGVEGKPFDSDGESLPASSNPQIAFQKMVLERYRNSNALGGWQFYCGKPIGDQFGKGMFGILWDPSEGAFKAQRKWLKEKYSLEELSLRWTGRKDAYKNWEDVPCMQLVDVIGGDWDEERWDLKDCDWYWCKAPDKEVWKGGKGWTVDENVEILTPPPADAKWVKAELPPSHRFNFLDQGRSWHRVTLKKCDWLEKNKGKKLYLRSVSCLMDGREIALWANGKRTTGKGGGVCDMYGLSIEPNTLRNDGKDVIIVELPSGRSGGHFSGPITLSPNPVQNFPYKDKRINARYLDNICFQDDKIIERNLNVYYLGRALDPNRPIALSGADETIFSKLAEEWGKNGFSLQSTSTDGFYWPFVSDLGRQHGFYFIGEPSCDVAAEDRFDRNFGTVFYTGASSTAVFMDIEQYMKFEKESNGGMSARKPITRLVGKYLIDEPNVGLYFSSLSSLCNTGTAYLWNLARGEAQSVPYDTAMVNDVTFGKMKDVLKRYPLMLDCGADVMNEKMVGDIERYVKEGGVFVAFTETGRHTELERDSHPFARISGFKTKDLKQGVQTLTFENQDVFPKWAGKKYNANGYGKYTHVNWRWNRALEKVSSDAEIFAKWDDGTIAAGVRKIGKGKVITLASGFWREASDIRGKWVPSRYNVLTDEFFGQLNAKRNASASSHHVWTRKATSKNGLEDWFIGFNIALDLNQNPIDVKADISFKTEKKPSRVFDAYTLKDVEWTYENGFVEVKNVEFGPFKTRIFVAQKDCNVTEGIKFWWDEKVKYWKRAPKYKVPEVSVKKDNIIEINEWEFSTNPEKGEWRKANNSTWKLQFPDLKDYKGPATYRARFNIPSAGKGKTYVVRFTHETIYDKADILVNGQKCGEFDQSRVHSELCGDIAFDISKFLKFGGENVLEIKVDGGSRFIAGVCDLIWIYEEKKLTDEIDMRGEWTLVMKDFLTEKKGKIPGRNFSRYMKKTVKIPEAWKGKNVYLKIVYPENTIGSIVVNGKSRSLSGNGHIPFGNRELFYVGDLIKPGEDNVIELWHRHTIPVDWKGKPWGWPLEATLNIDEVSIGVYEL